MVEICLFSLYSSKGNSPCFSTTVESVVQKKKTAGPVSQAEKIKATQSLSPATSQSKNFDFFKLLTLTI